MIAILSEPMTKPSKRKVKPKWAVAYRMDLAILTDNVEAADKLTIGDKPSTYHVTLMEALESIDPNTIECFEFQAPFPLNIEKRTRYAPRTLKEMKPEIERVLLLNGLPDQRVGYRWETGKVYKWPTRWSHVACYPLRDKCCRRIEVHVDVVIGPDRARNMFHVTVEEGGWDRACRIANILAGLMKF